jgi:hypothetical protein
MELKGDEQSVVLYTAREDSFSHMPDSLLLIMRTASMFVTVR